MELDDEYERSGEREALLFIYEVRSNKTPTFPSVDFSVPTPVFR
jgi:hypothetical protein